MAAKKAVKIEFFYDIISPYSFLAFEVLQRYKTLWKIDLKLKPMLLAGIMKVTGNSPPSVVPNKGLYIAKDIKRLQKYFDVPVFLPNNLMDLIMNRGSLNAMRFIITVDRVKPECVEGISRALWHRLYRDHKDIGELDSFREAGQSINMDPYVLETCLNSMELRSTRDQLVIYSDQACQLGAFGAPMIVAYINGKPEVFFGSDRFELLAHELGEKWYGPVPPDSPAAKL